jgi:predicted dehydrogenase
MKKDQQSCSRRQFINRTCHYGLSALTMAGLSSMAGCEQKQNSDQTKIKESMQQQQNPKKLGIALVGLGKYATGELAPALQETKNCYLAGIVTGTPEKAEKWKRKYNIPESNIYDYQHFDSIKDNPAIDIVYIVLPNAMHKEFVIRAARAGKHVICEKPMAVTVEDCDEMIQACSEANRMLSIGYRLHFEPYNLEMMRLGKEKTFGKIKNLVAEDGLKDAEGWRLDKELSGGGPLMDVGIYCVQGVRYTTGLEPIAVTATEGPKKDRKKFNEVEESLTWTMEMPGGIVAECKTSYSKFMNVLRAEAERGWFELSPAYEYKGLEGKTSEGKMDLPKVNQQARQMDAFAFAVANNKPTEVPGEMGRQDVKILQAIYKSMETGKRVEIQ